MQAVLKPKILKFDENSICLEISVCDTGNIDETPVVFCDVTAVNAVIAYDPKDVTVLMSACMPAPPEESEPAIIKILDFIFN